MANLKGSTGGSLGGGIINIRARGPVLEKNTETCSVCWSGKGYPCQTESGVDMKLTHQSQRSGKTGTPNRAAATKPAAAKAAAKSRTSSGRRDQKSQEGTARPAIKPTLPEKIWDDDWPETWGGKG